MVAAHTSNVASRDLNGRPVQVSILSRSEFHSLLLASLSISARNLSNLGTLARSPIKCNVLTDMATSLPISDRPRGTVTFLFTDIEGSTRLWEDGRSAMSEALERHDKILQEAITDSGGVIFSTGGDGLAAAFQRAPDALRAGTRRPSSASEPNVGPSAFGSHGGTHGRCGGTRWRLFRATPQPLCAPDGLCTRRAGALFFHHCFAGIRPAPRGSSLRDLGSHRLRDLSEPEHVFQVLHPNLRSDFPPLRSLDSYRGNLPVQPTVFIGREAELTEITKALDEARLVTLCGVGGVGKTRLALQVCRRGVAALRRRRVARRARKPGNSRKRG